MKKRIEETIARVPSTENSVLSIVNWDNERYGNKIREQYHTEIRTIDDKYIGGCILEDKIEGLYIDNTLQNSVNEKLES